MHIKPNVWAAVSKIRFPFVKPRIPPLGKVAPYFDAARDAGFYSNFGPVSIRFETALEERCLSGSTAVACANCTTGLSAALIALRVSGKVLIPAFTFAATASAVRGAGLRAVTGDVDPSTGVLTPSAVIDAVSRCGCEAVIAVRPYGIWCELSEVAAACARMSVPLVIDNAAGLGVSREIVTRFHLPDAVEVFSLHATKPFGVGEGGVLAASPGLQDDLRSALNFGLWAPGTLSQGTGLNGKMDELTAAMACAVLEELPRRVGERQAMARRFNIAALDRGFETFCPSGEEERSVWQCFPIKLPPGIALDAIVRGCAGFGLQVRRYYHPVLRSGPSPSGIDGAEGLSERVICLPVYDGEDAAAADDIWEIVSRQVPG